MEQPPGPAARLTAREDVLRRRLLTAACCVLLVAVALSSAPGQVGIDTKLDLVVDPAAIMRRSLQLWDPVGYFGQLQNQGYGYLFPMGPFFALALASGLPAWGAQAAWHAALLVLGFLGAQRVARLQGLGFGTAVAVGLCYALCPRVLTTLGPISSETLPVAVAPWVLVPLMRWRPGDPVRRPAAASAVAVLLAGGVNAVATLAVLVLPTLLLLTRVGREGAARLLGCWTAAVAAACAWWLVPLLVLGRYSPPFLDWIETSEITTSVTSLLDVVRGTSHWVARIADATGPLWPSGWAMVTSPAAAVAVAALSAVGLAGLTLRRLPAVAAWRLGVLAGVVLVGAGFTGSAVHGAAAGVVQDLLDGPLSPLRNVHKFDVVLRLPLLLGLGAVLQAAQDARGPAWALPRRLVAVAVAGAAAVSVTPAAAGQLAVDPRTEVVAAHYREAASWLSEHGDDSRALVVPSAPFASYSWGRTNDDALQPLMTSPWAVRDAQPLSSAGAIRLMDAVNNELGAGRGGPGLAPFLARAGVGHLVVRNDLDWYDGGSTRPALVQETLSSAPGLRRVAGFGPVLPTGRGDGTTVDAGTAGGVRAVEVWEVDDPYERVTMLPLDEAYVVSGGPEALLGMAQVGWLDDRAAFLAGDPHALAPDDGVEVLTDTLRRREYGFGAVRDNVSATLAADDPFRSDRVVHDYLPFPVADAALTVAHYGGIDSVRSSSSGSDPAALLSRSVSHQPFAAVDGDLTTSWTSGTFRSVGEWWEVRFDEPVDLSTVRLALAPPPATAPLRLRITTDRGESVVDVAADTLVQDVDVPPGPTSRLRLTAEDDGGQVFGTWGLTDVAVPGVVAGRTLDVAAAGAGPGPPTAPHLLFDVVPGRHADCLVLDRTPHCNPVFSARGEEDGLLDRTFEVEAAVDGPVELTGTARPGAELEAVLEAARGGWRARASGSLSADPRASAGAAVDGDRATGWIAAPDDEQPSLVLTLPAEDTVEGIRLVTGSELPAARPTRVRVEAGGTTVVLALPADGRVRLPGPVRTDRVTVTVLDAAPMISGDSGSGELQALPAGVSELEVLGSAARTDEGWLDRRVELGCGDGPNLLVDGARLPTRVTTTPRALRDLESLAPETCDVDSLALGPGEHRLRVESSALVEPTSFWVRPSTAPRTRAERAGVLVRTWDPTARLVEVPEGGGVLTLAENFNAGWRAEAGGVPLRAVRVDGWRQAFVVPPDVVGEVSIRFAGSRTYVVGLAVGGLLALLVVLLAAVPGRHVARPARRGHRSRDSDLLVVPLALLAPPVALLLVGGPVGLLAVVPAVLVVPLGRRLSAPWTGWVGADGRGLRLVVAATAFLAAGTVDAVSLAAGNGTGSTSPAAQVLVCVAVAVATVEPVSPAARAVRRWTAAIRGRSSRT